MKTRDPTITTSRLNFAFDPSITQSVKGAPQYEPEVGRSIKLQAVSEDTGVWSSDQRPFYPQETSSFYRLDKGGEGETMSKDVQSEPHDTLYTPSQSTKRGLGHGLEFEYSYKGRTINFRLSLLQIALIITMFSSGSLGPEIIDAIMSFN